MQNASRAWAGYVGAATSVGSFGESRPYCVSDRGHGGVRHLPISGREPGRFGNGQWPGDGGALCANRSPQRGSMHEPGDARRRDRFHQQRHNDHRAHGCKRLLFGRAARGQVEGQLQGLHADHQGTIDGDGDSRCERDRRLRGRLRDSRSGELGTIPNPHPPEGGDGAVGQSTADRRGRQPCPLIASFPTGRLQPRKCVVPSRPPRHFSG